MGVKDEWEKAALEGDLTAISQNIANAAKEATAQEILSKVNTMPDDILNGMGNLSGKETFTADGTFTVPRGVTKLRVSGCGAGGSVYAGEYAIEKAINVIPGEVLQVVVGTGATKLGNYINLSSAATRNSVLCSKLGYTTGYQGGDGGRGGYYSGNGSVSGSALPAEPLTEPLPL